MQKFWNEKRYYSFDYYLKNTFGEKIYRISLNGGMTCPNRDGNLDTRGCIFCSAGGSGDFAAPVSLSITEQIAYGRQQLLGKFPCKRFIAYFQAYTNTYAPVSYLRKIFTEALMHPDIVALSIATRPDCLNDDVLELLDELNQIKPVWIDSVCRQSILRPQHLSGVVMIINVLLTLWKNCISFTSPSLPT